MAGDNITKLYTKESLDELESKIDLVKFISFYQYVSCIFDTDSNLNSLYATKCPFHKDGKSILFIKNDKCYCFDCDFSGKAVEFLMASRNMSFQESVEFLANLFDVKMKYIEVKKSQTKGKIGKREFNRIQKALAEERKNDPTTLPEMLEELKSKGIDLTKVCKKK